MYNQDEGCAALLRDRQRIGEMVEERGRIMSVYRVFIKQKPRLKPGSKSAVFMKGLTPGGHWFLSPT
jgi:hypothetical protein